MANWDLADPATPSATGGIWDSAPVHGGSTPGAQQAQDLSDAVLAGLQNSATGLALRRKMPTIGVSEDSPWYHRLASSAAGIVADLPLSVLGAAGGAAAGSPGGPVGAVIGGGAGAFGAPMALRDSLIEAYTHNYALDWNGVWQVAKAGLKGGAKGAVIGGVTAGAGRIVAPLAGSMAVSRTMTADVAETAFSRAATGGALTAELGAMTSMAAALEGHMPTWQDFADNALLLGGMKAATHYGSSVLNATRNMRNIYAETGKTPAEILADAEKDPSLKAALEGEPKADVPEQYRELAINERIQAAIDKDVRPDEILRRKLAADESPIGEPARDVVKYEYITDQETHKGVLRAVTEMYQTEITAQTRGVVSNKETAAAALRAVSDGAISEHVIGEAGNAAEIYARAHLLRGATNDAVLQMQKLAGMSPVDLTPAVKLQALAALERVAMFKAELEGVGAEAGRALQIFRTIKRDPSFLGEAEGLLKVAERKGNLQDVAALLAKMKDPAQVAEFARQYTSATFTEKLLEAWRAAILTGPQTHIANILGNVTKWLVEIPESAISASLFALDKAAKGDALTIAQWKARAFAPFYGLQMGAKEAIYAAAEVWKMSGEHVEKADQYRQAIEGKAGEIIRLPFKALQVADVLFRTVAERGEAYKLAIDRAVKEGLHPETAEYRQQVALYTARPEFGLPMLEGKKVIEGIQQTGAESVFSQRLGPRMEIAQRAIAGHPISFIVPFVRTPANLVSWAIQHVPGLNLVSGRWREDFMAGGERQAKALSRVLIGTGLSITAYSLAQQGLLTGGGMFDKEERGTKSAAGIQPYSIKIGDKYYSYQRIEPVAKVLGLAADLVELSNNLRDEDSAAKVASMLVLMFGNATVSTTYLSGLSNAIQAISDPARSGENFMEQYAASVVPKAIGQTAAAIDPHKREVNGILDAIQSQIPFLREKLLPKRDVWGEPQQNEKWFGIMPIQTSQISEDKVRTEAARMHLAIADAPRFLLERGPFNAKDKRLDLTDVQRDIIKEVSGKNAMALLTPIVNAPDWNQIPDFAKAEIYKHIIEGTRKQGQYAAIPPDAEQRQQLREKIVNKIIKQSQDAQGK